MRAFRWWLGKSLFCISFSVMPLPERVVSLRLIHLGTKALREELEQEPRE